MKHPGIRALILLVVLVSSCKGSYMETLDPQVDVGTAAAASGVTFFFGHQSVGVNLLEGLSQVPEFNSSIVEVKHVPSNVEAARIYHSTVGRNYFPHEKISDFDERMRGAMSAVDAAGLKFCYLDVTGDVDVQKLFDDYVATMERLELDYPETAIVYFTMPLRVSRGGIKGLAKWVLRRDRSGREGNADRHTFNQLLREAKGDTGRLFDIALFESTYLDGSRETFRLRGVTHEALVPEYTDDGGHLNDTGRRVVATEFVAFLAELSKKKSG